MHFHQSRPTSAWQESAKPSTHQFREYSLAQVTKLEDCDMILRTWRNPWVVALVTAAVTLAESAVWLDGVAAAASLATMSL